MIVTVSELNSCIKEFFDLNPLFNNIFVKGELSNFKHHSSGHCYMTLKDEKANVKAVMFKSNAMKLNFIPEDGMKVIVSARVSVYERDGVYQLYVEEMQPDGVGTLYVQFNQLKEKLEKEGLFDSVFKKKIPSFPETVGVVTSETGAAVRDIINVIKRRSKVCNIIIYPAQVQGKNAYTTIVDGIKYFNKNKVDVMIIGRGGGSIEDLWCFNEEAVAREIFKSEVPVVSAVGHETDFTISDFVADLRAPTPSAAAELCVPNISELMENLVTFRQRLKNGLLNLVIKNRQKIQYIIQKNIFKHPERLFENKNLELNSYSNRLIFAMKETLADNKELFIKNISKLDSLSPLKVLKRGYSFVEDDKGNIIDSCNKLKKDMNVKLRFADGNADLKVIDKEAFI